ncbi:MAG: hypothetical protein HYX38_21025 [Rhodospirillales bacterium]|nr:hypothetical protein [Rhodospirillales bacterium]
MSNTSQGRESASRALFGFLDACSPYDDYLLRRLERVAVGAEETFEKGYLVASHCFFTRPLPETMKPSADRALILVKPLPPRTAALELSTPGQGIPQPGRMGQRENCDSHLVVWN